MAASHPNAPAVAGPVGQVSYRELWDGVQACREVLEPLGLRPGTTVAILSNGSPDLAALFLGVRAADLVPVPVDTLLPHARRAAMLRAARPAAVIGLSAGLVVTAGADDPLVLPEEAGYVVFSSGTQGPPKGIVGNAAGLARFLDWEAELLGSGPDDRVAQLTSPSFDVVLRELLLPLVSGGVLCVAGAEVRSDAGAVLPWLADLGVTVVHPVPSLSSRWADRAGPARLPDLQWTLFAGEPLYARHVERWCALAPATRVANLYGPSETTLAKFWHLLGDQPDPGLQPVGLPLPGTRLVPDRSSASLSPHEGDGTFRIVIESPDGSLGYLPADEDRADATGLTRANGVTTFVTQDRGRLDQHGLLHVEGRLDSRVKRLGVLVNLAQLDADAVEGPGVKQACAVQVDVDTTGEVVLAVVGSEAFSTTAFVAFLRRRLGPAMPNEVLLFESLPLLPNGKVDRREVLAAVRTRRGTSHDTSTR